MKKILVNKDPWQTRVAITEDGKLQNIYFESHTEKTLERAFFKGVVLTVLPGIQTLFVDIGQERAGFLHISEIDRELAIKQISGLDLDEEAPQRDKSNKRIMDVGKIFNVGDTVLVQVSKEPVYEKGAKLTTCFTVPGRFLVLLPNIPRFGVSKKIEDRAERQRLRELVKEKLPEGMGAIIRTTAEGASENEIGKDLAYLLEIWHTIQKKYETIEPTAKIFKDFELSLQVVRDNLDESVEAIITDNKDTQAELYKFVRIIAPDLANKVTFFNEPVNLFDHYNIEDQIAKALHKKVPLRSGGSLIIETTEAMTVVDVNTGSFTGRGSMEETVLKTNLEAAEETVRQLRLRNIGGLIVIDFIDMAESESRNKLFSFFDQMLKERDRFQSVVLKISEFGLVQMTRKRSGKTLVQKLTNTCQCCSGYGFVKSVATQTYTILRAFKLALRTESLGGNVQLMVSKEVFEHITKHEYDAILQMEKNYRCKISIKLNESFDVARYQVLKENK